MTITAYIFVAITITAAYSVFGLTGFGAALVAIPILVQFFPLEYAVPAILLLDLVATTLVGYRNWSIVSLKEIIRIFPCLLLGVYVGSTALSTLNSKWLLIALGIFVFMMAVNNLWKRNSVHREIGQWWAVPAGLVGGIFSALFGTGGPIYTVYLVRRLHEIDEFRSTISVVIFISALVRIITFSATGLLLQEGLLLHSVYALPFSLIGLWIGSSFRRRISPLAVKRILLTCLALGGTSVMYRGISL